VRSHEHVNIFPHQQPESTKGVFPFDVESGTLKWSIGVLRQPGITL